MKFLTAKDLQEILQISQSSSYELMRRVDFPSINIGKSKRVKEDDFYNWLESQKG